MKKYLLMAVCIIMMSMTASAVTVNKAMLLHDGEVTLFDGSNMQGAVDAAQDGDTIYLTLGTFNPFTISKKITIRGTGETSIINGDVTIKIPYTPVLESPLLESLAVSGSVTISSELSNLLIRKCKISGGFYIGSAVNGGTFERCQLRDLVFYRLVSNTYYSGTVDNLYLDRCRITNNLVLRSNISSMTVLNTMIAYLSASSSISNNTTFFNCRVDYIDNSYFSATIINSIINRYSNSSYASINSSVLLNTLVNTKYLSVGSSSVAQNCYLVNNPSTSVSDLKYNGYLGDDGTIVGPYGGSTPYSEEDMFKPLVPTVTNSKLNLDLEKKELNVTLTVSPQ